MDGPPSASLDGSGVVLAQRIDPVNGEDCVVIEMRKVVVGEFGMSISDLNRVRRLPTRGRQPPRRSASTRHNTPAADR